MTSNTNTNTEVDSIASSDVNPSTTTKTKATMNSDAGFRTNAQQSLLLAKRNRAENKTNDARRPAEQHSLALRLP